MGCEQVIYVTREGDESGFATKIAKQAGMDEATGRTLYDLSDRASSYTSRSRRPTPCGARTGTRFERLSDGERWSLDAFNAPLETRAALRRARAPPLENGSTERTGKAGCTPGISGGATFPQ